MKHTAVEWLVEQLKENNMLTFDEWIEIVEQAKEMEKEQIIKAASWTPEDGLRILSELADQYYNETFKSDGLV